MDNILEYISNFIKDIGEVRALQELGFSLIEPQFLERYMSLLYSKIPAAVQSFLSFEEFIENLENKGILHKIKMMDKEYYLIHKYYLKTDKGIDLDLIDLGGD